MVRSIRGNGRKHDGTSSSRLREGRCCSVWVLLTNKIASLVSSVPSRQPKKGRLWLNDGSCVRLRPQYRNHVWSFDFVHCRIDDGKVFRTLNILDEFSRECLAIRVRRKLNSTDVIDALIDLFILRGPPAYIRSDNGPGFVAGAGRDWIATVGTKTAYIEPGSPGRTAIARASTPGCGMNCSTARSSIRSGRPRSSSKAGVGTTMANDLTAPLATDHRHLKPSFR